MDVLHHQAGRQAAGGLIIPVVPPLTEDRCDAAEGWKKTPSKAGFAR